ncbi:hypothetical protein KKR94_p00315 (plasmid) [Klebsiella pneumoniae]|nr:hypothetical protein KKR94_p00315 [Klebsiella pneumoniae]
MSIYFHDRRSYIVNRVKHTATDFIGYLNEKERVVLKNIIGQRWEEETLAAYIKGDVHVISKINYWKRSRDDHACEWKTIKPSLSIINISSNEKAEG